MHRMASSDTNGEHVVVQDPDQTIKYLKSLKPVTSEYEDAVARVLEKQDVAGIIRNILESTCSSPLEAKTCELIAELAKADVARKHFLENDLIKYLIPQLESPDREVCWQCVRALGNMCYEQDASREQILRYDGVDKLKRLMEFCMDKFSSSDMLKTACCGFLHNLLNGNEQLQRAALNCGMVNVIKSMLELNAHDGTICNFCFSALSSLTEVDEGKSVLEKSGILTALLKVLVNTQIRDTDVELITLMSSLVNESDDAKRQIAESSVDMHLLSIISLLSRSTDHEEQQLVQSVTDLIVLVLTGDEAMKIWFDKGNGLVFTSVCEWLHSSNAHLLQAAAFALGNFARDDENSRIIILKGVSLELCRCLDELYSIRDDNRSAPTLHALLSALRNLAISAENKALLLEQGVLNHILPYSECESSVVTSKLVGVLRLIIDKNEKYATILGSNKLLIERLVKFGHTDQNMLLKGEATRCLAWIVKNTRDNSVYHNILSSDAMPHFVFLISSEHTVMQNEGLLSLILLSSALPGQTVSEIRKSTLMLQLKDLITKEELPVAEVLQNLLILISRLIANGLKQEINDLRLLDSLMKIRERFDGVEAMRTLFSDLVTKLA